jgi:hypothetical protein
MDRTRTQERIRAKAKRRRLEELTAEANYAAERYRLYKAKVHGPRLTSPGRLRELDRAHHLADARLRRARSESSGDLSVSRTGAGS